MLILHLLHAQYGKKQSWWVFYNKPKSFLFGDLPNHIGPFFAMSMWSLKWTYGNFKWFILLNGIGNAIYAYLITYLARYFTLVRINNFQLFLFFFSKAFLLYAFQYLFEKNIRQQGKEKFEILPQLLQTLSLFLVRLTKNIVKSFT
jgi:signal transduction histidine kinase